MCPSILKETICHITMSAMKAPDGREASLTQTILLLMKITPALPEKHRRTGFDQVLLLAISIRLSEKS